MRQDYRPNQEDRQDYRPIQEDRQARQTQEDRPSRQTQEDKPTQSIKEIVKGFIGRNVTVVVRGKKTFSGKLETVSNYEIFLTVKQKPVLIMKHAIDYIELDETPS